MKALVLTFFALCLALAACERSSAPDAGPRLGTLAVGGNAVLATTGSTSSNGLVIAGRHTVRSSTMTNLTGSNMWATFQDQATVPDAGYANLVGNPVFLPANTQVVLGTDFFGVDGWAFANGVAVGMTTTGSNDAGGTWTAAGSACCDITVNGQ